MAWNHSGPQGSKEHGHFTMKAQCGYPVVAHTPYCEKHQPPVFVRGNEIIDRLATDPLTQ